MFLCTCVYGDENKDNVLTFILLSNQTQNEIQWYKRTCHTSFPKMFGYNIDFSTTDERTYFPVP